MRVWVWVMLRVLNVLRVGAEGRVKIRGKDNG